MSSTTDICGSIAPRGLAGWIERLRESRLARNFGWYMIGEMVVRVSRLATTVILARILMPADFGIAAIALTTYELIRVFAANGSSAFIVRASETNFAAACLAINRVSYVVALFLYIAQMGAGAVIAHVSGRPDLLPMLALLAFAHVAVPLTEVCYARLQRENRLKALAGVMSAQVLADNALSAGLALAGYGAWALVLPKVLTVPLYVALLWRASPEPLPRGGSALSLGTFLPFAFPFLGNELLAAMRLHLDKVLVAAVLGVEMLGVYSFAFNAGLGISIAMTAALSASLFPHFSEAQRSGGDMLREFDLAIKRMVLPVSLLIGLQALAALIYVPIVFGERWVFAAPFVALICLSGLLRPLYDASCQLLRARGETRLELAGATIFTAVLLAVFAATLNLGILPALVALAATSIAGHATFALWARSRCARNDASR